MERNPRDSQQDVRFGEWTATHHEVSEPFAQVPKAFTQGMSPSELQAMQAVYEAAYQKAIRQVGESDPNREWYFDLGGGI